MGGWDSKATPRVAGEPRFPANSGGRSANAGVARAVPGQGEAFS